MYAILSSQEEDNSGKYFENCATTNSSAISYDKILQEQLWNKTWHELRPWLGTEEFSQLVTAQHNPLA